MNISARAGTAGAVMIGLALAGVLVPAPARAQTPEAVALAQANTSQLKRMSLEELMGIDVSTVSRTPEPASNVPAAVYVITQDDIRRSGATSLPEVLRLAPEVQVSQIDASRYAIGIRGFPDRLSRSMLVLIDGRAVYSPLFAGTYWEVQDSFMPDIDRIEVIRGPGGTLWGANAVNGIINIITKDAGETQGAAFRAASGTSAWGPFSARFGGTAGTLKYRVYGKIVDRQPQFHPDGVEYDTFTMGQGGFRGDWNLSGDRRVTLQGDAYVARLGEPNTITTYTPPYSQVTTQKAPLAGGNVLLRWSVPTSHNGSVQVQTYYDRTSRDELPVGEVRDTVDVDFQHARTMFSRHSFVWGAGYRMTTGVITAAAPSDLQPPRRTDNLFTAFVQDEVALGSDAVRLVGGTKIEHNDYSGVEFQPSARFVWTPAALHTVVLSVTRAVRTPSRVETDYTTTSLVSPATPTFVRLQPNPAFVSESMVAYEAGYRVRPRPSLYLTASTFYNDHAHALSTELLPAFVETGGGPARLILPVEFRNGLQGRSYGGAATGDFRPVSWWRGTANYSYERIQVNEYPGANDVSQEVRYEGMTPRHAFGLQSSIDLPGQVSVDWLFRHVSTATFGPVPAYSSSTIRVGWQASSMFELSLVGANLGAAHHLEWVSGPFANTEIARSVALELRWRK